MQVYCKACQKVLGNYPDEKLTPNVKKYVSCNKCGERILLLKKAETSPSHAGSKSGITASQETAPRVPVTPQKPEPPSAPPQKTGEKDERRIFRPQFSGSAGEYFRIWIVNTFLTIVTLGIYAAWAKVRTRRYFYAHTKIAGHPFDYIADPVAILKGNLIVGGGFFLYSASGQFYPTASAVIAVIMALIFPLLIYKSLRFYAHNSVFRNIRFRFRGDLKESYFTYMLIPLLIPFTFGLIMPYWVYRRKKYFFNNFDFGTAGNSFLGSVGPFYRIYGAAVVMMALIIAGGVALFLGMGANFMTGLTSGATLADAGGLADKAGKMVIIGLVVSYLLMLSLFTLIQQYLYARLNNYCWHHSKLGKISFKSSIQARKLAWIRITNIVAIILSLGFMMPWAKIRRTRYILDNLVVIADCSLDDFTAAVEEEESALGDAATDFFDFEIGL